ncbi:MAG TPA: type IX secretion system outer membrane channel protein PorV [Chitinophagaceae bacterium]|nr:type IX secretion system outer membrane channel protein PorV [Chitinophagaceae bacterium]
MKKVSLKLIALAICATGSINVIAQTQTKPINVVTTAVPFLRISPDARSGGMGDVGIATTPDANSSFWNQAKIPFAQSKAAIAVSYTPWLKGLGLNDVYLASLAGYYQLDETQAISSSLRYFSLGNIDFTDQNGLPIGSNRPREFGFDLGYSRKLSDKLGLGIALRYINSSLASGNFNGQTYKAGSSVAGDISIFHDGTGGDPNAGGLNWGIALHNLGSKISYTNDALQKDYIPANLGIGVAYTKIFDETSKATFGLDINKLMVPTPPVITGNPTTDSTAFAKYRGKGVLGSWFSSFGDAPGGGGEEMRELQVSLGAEYMYNNQFAFRAGYFYEAPSKGNRQYFTVGAGINYNMYGLNFSYLIPSGAGVNRNPLANTIRFSLIFNLDSESAGN